MNPRNHELARELARAISQLPLALQPAARRHVREYLADFARALAAGESPDAFMARRKQVFRFLKRRASGPRPRRTTRPTTHDVNISGDLARKRRSRLRLGGTPP